MSKSGTQGGGTASPIPYSPPQGPSNINDRKAPGLHGSTYRQGSQGPTPCDAYESGSPGLGGKNHGNDGS
jgi:hypothetical protein